MSQIHKLETGSVPKPYQNQHADLFGQINRALVTSGIDISENKGKLCNTIASVALVHTSVQSDLRIQTMEILATSNSKQIFPQSCPETSEANSRLVHAKGGF